MTPERWQLVKELFHAALECSPESRSTFLDRRCPEDSGVRRQVERLLSAHEAAGEFGERPLLVSRDALDQHAAGPGTAPPPAGHRAGEARGSSLEHPAAEPSPFRWAVRAAAVLTVLAASYAGVRLATERPHAPELGWSEARLEGRWVVGSVDPTGPAAGRLVPGDVVVALDGGPPYGAVGTRPYRRALDPGAVYRLTVEREGRRVEVPLEVAEGRSLLAQRVTYGVLFLAWCLVGLFIGAVRPNRPDARLAAATSWVTGLVFLDFAFLAYGPVLHPLHVLLGYHFFCRFPSGEPTRGARRWSLVLLYVAGGLSVVLAVALWAARIWGGASAPALLAGRFPLVVELRGLLATHTFRLALVLIVVVAAANYRRLSNEDQRRRVRWLVLGATLGLAPQLVWMIAGIMVGARSVAWMETPANLFTAVIPVATAYVVLRHRVFDIRIVVRRGLQYLLARRVLQAAVALPLVALLATLVRHRELTLVELVGETRAYLVWIMLSSVVLNVRTPLQRSLDRRFFREQYDRDQILLEMLKSVGKVDSISELARMVHGQLESALHPTAAYVWYRDPDELALVSSSHPMLSPPDVPAEGRWLAWLERTAEATALPFPAEAGVPHHESRWFEEREIGLLVPIMDSAERLVGALLLGEKRSEEPYSASDTKLLGVVARQAAVVRENLRLRARVGEEVRIKHEVLARLDGNVADLLKECPRCQGCYDSTVERCPADGTRLLLTLPVRRTIEGRYRLERLLGKGGMGAVYEARDLRLERTVAVKILLGRGFGSGDALSRFRREARATARLSHPNIVTVFDYGVLEGGGAYLILERVTGATLRAELDRRGALGPTDTAAWFEPLLEGVAAAHRAGIVHRDLKPENVMGQAGPNGTIDVKVLDLGLVKLLDAEGDATGSTTLGLVMGTLAYMAPEQFAARSVDARADVFSLGVMLTEALTGRAPLSAMDPKRAGALARWSEQLSAGAHCPRALQEVVGRCVATDPARRYASADALREPLLSALRRWSEGSAAATQGTLPLERP